MQEERALESRMFKVKDKKEKDSSDATSVAESTENVLSVSTSSVGNT